ncbi:hypothetical protein KMT30_04850 [Streptomyces sp. IBSBF 2953]|nr:hypothetical protein [Streptomyces hayashii]
MSATIADEAPPLTKSTIRAAASWFLAQETLPRHQTVKLFGDDFAASLTDLIEQVEQLAAQRGADDVPSMAALAGAGEARRRLSIAERPGLLGEVERVKKLARSVLALRDHYDALTGIWMCLACDRVIDDAADAQPYSQASPTSGNGHGGRIHKKCVNVVRFNPR